MASKKKPRTKSKNTYEWMTVDEDDDVWICTGCKQMSKELTTNCWSASTVINITALNASKLRIKNMADKPQIHWLSTV